jgi:cyclohexanone monooxygenase
LAAEHHADWITDCIAYLDDHHQAAIEATEQAQDDWVAYGNELASHTLFPATNSWYVGANIEGKPRTFMPFIGGLGTYRNICADIAERGYAGFQLLPQ